MLTRQDQPGAHEQRGALVEGWILDDVVEERIEDGADGGTLRQG